MTDIQIKNYSQKPKQKTRLSLSELLMIRYAAAYIMLFTLGLIGYYVVKIPQSDKLNGYINTYFSYTYKRELGVCDNLTALFWVSFSDLKTVFLIFVSGFTMFSSIAIYSLLGYHALSLGFSCLYLVNTMSIGSLCDVSFFDLIFFLISNAAISSILIVFSSKTKCFNESFKKIRLKNGSILSFKPMYVQIFTLASLCGAVILINMIRFLLNTL